MIIPIILCQFYVYVYWTLSNTFPVYYILANNVLNNCSLIIYKWISTVFPQIHNFLNYSIIFLIQTSKF